MTKEVLLKSNKHGIVLVLPAQISFEELLPLIAAKFKEVGNFFKDAKMAIAFEGRELTVEQELAIIEVIGENCDIKIVSVIDGDTQREALMEQRVAASENQMPEDGIYTGAYGYTSGQPVMGIAGSEDTMPVADFYKGNLRSGQTLECSSSVTLIGDVNPGAKIISDGNIVVLGSMKGNAHAGASGNSKCFIFALDMRPIQLQIGNLIAKSPDKESGGWRLKKRTRDESSQYASQIAVVRDGYICIEPMTKGCLDKL